MLFGLCVLEEAKTHINGFVKVFHSYDFVTASPKEHKLFFRIDDGPLRFGAIGYLRGDFGKGDGFYTSWFDTQKQLKSNSFKREFDTIVHFLREEADYPVLKNRAYMRAYCYNHCDEQHINGTIYDDAAGFKIQTDDYSYYVRCTPQEGDYDLYIFCYDNDYLLPELAGEHEMPNDCYSILPSSGELIFIVYGEDGYFPQGKSTPVRDMNRQIATAKNTLLGITRAQEEAMLAGSMFGWDTPAAKPWNYDNDGNMLKPRQPPKTEQER